MEDRVFVEDWGDGATAVVRGEELHHLSRVRRLGPGDRVEVFDGRGRAELAEVREVSKERAVLRLEGVSLPSREPHVDLTLATAVPKGDRFDWLVEKAVELGVRRLVPLRTDRSVVDPRSGKLDRLRRAVIESSKQCGRNLLMEVAETSSWAELLRSADQPGRWFAMPGGQPLPTATAPAPRIIVAIGPEGGLTEAEAQAAVSAGWSPVGLGPTILRVETAALAACVGVLSRGW